MLSIEVHLVSLKIIHNACVYDQLRLQSADVSSYDDFGGSVTDISVLYFSSGSHTTAQQLVIHAVVNGFILLSVTLRYTSSGQSHCN